jgi:hypothetical protein
LLKAGSCKARGVVGGRRYSFDDALVRRLKELEARLDDHREQIARESQRWTARIERAAIEQRKSLEAFAGDKVTELERAATREAFAATASGNTTAARMDDLREGLRAQTALLDELASLHAAASELDHARALTVDALRRGMDALGRDVLAAVEQPHAVDRHDEGQPPAVHWSAPPDEPLPG